MPLQMLRIGRPRASEFEIASNSQRSLKGSTSLSIKVRSTFSWRKNSGAISEPPVSSKPSIWSMATLPLHASKTRTSGCFAKNGWNHFSSLGRIHVARLGIGEFATFQRLCKEHSHVMRRWFHQLRERIGKADWYEQGSRERGGAARSRERVSVFATRRPLVSWRQHYQSGSAPRDFSRSGRGSASAGRSAPRTKSFYQRSRWSALSTGSSLRRVTRAVPGRWTNRKDFRACGRNDCG